MRTVVKGKNIELSDRIRRYAERKFDRIERLLDDRSEALLELSVEQHRSSADSHIAEVTLVIDGQTLRSHAAGPSHQAAIDTVTDKVERRAVDHKEKPLRARARRTGTCWSASRTGRGTDPRAADREDEAIRHRADVRRGRRRRDGGPGPPFFMFVNAETERVNVLYAA